MAQVVQVEALIPTNIDVSLDASDDDNSKEESPNNLKYGASKPGPENMATNHEFSSPLGLFAGASLFESSNIIGGAVSVGESVSVQTNHSKRLGIARPSYGGGALIDDDATTRASVASARIGILRPNYDLAEGEMPISPLELYLDKKKATSSSPTPNLIEADGSESDGDNLWQLKLLQNQHTAQLEVTTAPPPIQPMPNDNVDRLVHKQTSEGHYLVNSRPLDSPMAGMKYSLTGGKKAMPSNQRRASYDSKNVKTRPNALVPTTATESSDEAAPGKSAAFKIFLLLMQPKSKIFEIIQVFYSPSHTTIKNLLAMIPANATEPALGSQSYVGLCRPKDGQPINVDMMASAPSDVGCAKIIQGEILVAIPEHYSGTLCAKISKPILSNPKVTKLLTRSDPLAPSKRKKKKRSNHRSASNTIAIETVKEETESLEADFPVLPTPPPPPPRKNMKEERSKQEKDALRMALQHAAMEAASTNAEVRSDAAMVDAGLSDSASLQDDCDIPVEMWKTTMSLKTRSSMHRSDSIGDASTIASIGEFDGNNSVTSLDTTDYQYKRMPRRARRAASNSIAARRNRRKKQCRLLAGVVLVMICRYVMVGRQRLLVVTVTTADDNSNVDESPDMFGLFSLLQVCLALFAFVKTQRYLEGRGEVQDCPFVQFVSTAWKRSQQQINNVRS